ncbi:pyrimidine reductase family protein [Plantibacter sp. YIM 135249]|uniref:pyrimidine reductase family protein n=1 Tax=Plantibacter sp. YIM 135249 TaxID=3423918 RepID=UPI003D35727D
MTGSPTITRLLPGGGVRLDLDGIIDAYAPADRGAPTVRVNFVTSLDGSATVDGVSGGLGGPADKLVFDVLRRLADVVLVGAGTVRTEGYGAMRLEPDAAAWREAHGLPPHPVFALVSGRLDLDPSSDIFQKAPVRPIVLAATSADTARRTALEEVSDIIDCGDEHVDPARAIAALVERGLPQILCEGGPSLFGSFIRDDVVDELCLTISPTLVGGEGMRIASGDASPSPRRLRLAHLLEAEGLLLARYAR